MLHQHNVVNLKLSHAVSMESPLGYLSLNFSELKCLEIALHFLTEQLGNVVPHLALVNLRQHHVDYLQMRLKRLLSKCRGDSETQSEQKWQISSLEDIEWLDLALAFGICWETVISMAKDAANYEYDMQHFATKFLDALSYDASSDAAYFSKHLHYYSQFMQFKTSVQTKLRAALER